MVTRGPHQSFRTRASRPDGATLSCLPATNSLAASPFGYRYQDDDGLESEHFPEILLPASITASVWRKPVRSSTPLLYTLSSVCVDPG